MSIENEFQRTPASISQEHHVFNHSLDILSFPALVCGQIDQERMRAALQSVVNRHPALRTRFINEHPIVFRETFKLEALPIYFQKIQLNNPNELKKYIVELEKEQRASFPKRTQGPLFKCLFATYDDQSSIFILIMDHIICDAWSIILFCKELFSTYESQEQSHEICDDPYTDFVLWQKNRIVKQQSEIAKYWSRLKEETNITQKNLSNTSIPSTNRELLKFSKEETQKLQHFCHEHRVSLFTALLAAFKFLLCHLHLENNPIRMVHSGRFRHKWKSTIGLFASSTWVEIPAENEGSLADFVKITQKSLQDAIKWSFVPCEYLEKLGAIPAASIEIDYMPMDIFSHIGQELTVNTLFDESLDYLQPDLDMQLLCYHHEEQLGLYLIYKNKIANENISHHLKSFLSRMMN